MSTVMPLFQMLESVLMLAASKIGRATQMDVDKEIDGNWLLERIKWNFIG